MPHTHPDPSRNLIIVTDKIDADHNPVCIKLTPSDLDELGNEKEHTLSTGEKGAVKALTNYGCLLASAPDVPGIGAVCVIVNLKKLLEEEKKPK